MEKEILNVHLGHRERVREKINKNGLSSLPAHEILEYMLFHVIPRVNTNGIAHQLIKHFGSFNQVLEANQSELLKFRYVSTDNKLTKLPQNAITYLSTQLELARIIKNYSLAKKPLLNNINACFDYLKVFYDGAKTEELSILCLDNNKYLIKNIVIKSAEKEYINISIKSLTQQILDSKAHSILISHCHVEGLAVPSNNDMVFTRNLKNIMTSLNIHVLDHIIISPTDEFSFRESNVEF